MTNITGIILAGGRSQRMGSDKALLMFNNKRMIEYPVQLLTSYCNQVLISANSNAYNFLNNTIIKDEFPFIGPIGGIHATLKASETPYNIILAADMPLVDEEIISIILTDKELYDVIIPVVDSFPIAVCGMYNKSIVPMFETEIKAGHYKMQQLLKSFNTKYIEIHDVVTKAKLKNINTREDYKATSISTKIN